MALYRIIDVGGLHSTIANCSGFTWPSEEIRKATLRENWDNWYPKVGMIGKVIWKLPYSRERECLILEINDGSPHYVVIGRLLGGSKYCEPVTSKPNAYTIKYLALEQK